MHAVMQSSMKQVAGDSGIRGRTPGEAKRIPRNPGETVWVGSARSFGAVMRIGEWEKHG